MSLQREELLALSPQTGTSGESSSRSFSTATMLEAHARVTTGSSITRFDIWLQFSDDDVNWFDGIFDLSVATIDTGAEGATRANLRNIINNQVGTAAQSVWAQYKHMPARYVRAKWKLNGTSVTVSVVLTGK